MYQSNNEVKKFNSLGENIEYLLIELLNNYLIEMD